MVNLDDLTELESEDIFKLKALPVQSYEKNDDTQLAVTIEMDLNQR